MNKELALKIVNKISEQHSKADYMLGEVESYLNRNNYIDKKFRDWFMRQYEKYRE